MVTCFVKKDDWKGLGLRDDMLTLQIGVDVDYIRKVPLRCFLRWMQREELSLVGGKRLRNTVPRMDPNLVRQQCLVQHLCEKQCPDCYVDALC